MSPLIKALLAGAPFVAAIAIYMMNLQPSLDELTAKSTELDEKKTKRDELTTKLQGEGKVNAQKQQLEAEISSLRSSVPKSPDLDLFTIDLEKMCIEAGMDLISVGPPKDVPGGGSSSDGASSKIKMNRDKVKALIKGEVPPPDSSKPSDLAKKDKEEAPVSEVEEMTRQVVLTGSYHSLRKLVHKLESYQRVIKITQLIERIPKKPGDSKKVELPDESEPTEGSDLGDPKLLYVSMNITAYYLP